MDTKIKGQKITISLNIFLIYMTPRSYQIASVGCHATCMLQINIDWIILPTIDHLIRRVKNSIDTLESETIDKYAYIQFLKHIEVLLKRGIFIHVAGNDKMHIPLTCILKANVGKTNSITMPYSWLHICCMLETMDNSTHTFFKVRW